MPEDVTAVRLRLAQIVAQAETDEDFRSRLAEDPSAVLAENGIPGDAVEEYSLALQDGRRRTLAFEAAEDDDPTSCIHTAGCNDFTCIATICGPTCFVTIRIDAPDA
jgi:hypothetical protein